LDPVERHGQALAGFTAAVERVPGDAWERPTPCTAWDARCLVEHVIGFHEFMVLRPLGVRSQRPRAGPAARWRATDAALRHVHADPALRDPAPYVDGVRRRPVDVLDAVATDTLIHTWDLARAVGAPDRLDRVLCERAYEDAVSSGAARSASGLYAAPFAVDADADLQDRLLGLLGRDPAWRQLMG
jgi:uncharacterized protein (TIGR03086 family)